MLNHIIGLPVPVKMYKMYQCYWFIDLCRNSNKLGQKMLDFYRATLCVNVVFAVARCLSVCLSVRLSVTLVDCIQTPEDIKLLSRPGSPIILVFFYPERQYPIPFQRGRKVQGLGKFCDFRLKSPFISETVRDRPMVAMER